MRRAHNFIDITGKKFGKLSVLHKIENKVGSYWLVRCDCGTLKKIQSGNLRNGFIVTCGCRRRKKEDHSNFNSAYELASRELEKMEIQ